MHPPNCYSLRAIAKMFNNEGAQMLQNQRYEHAIQPLAKALKISERLAVSSPSSGCPPSCCFRCCDLGQSISSSFEDEDQELLQKQQRRQCVSTKKGNERSSISSQNSSSSTVINAENDIDGGYICQKPIYISSVSIEEDHDMGSTLSVILIFNLALAYHLSALQSSSTQHLFGRSIQLYEIVGKLLRNEANKLGANGLLRLTMVVANNLSVIHGFVQNYTRQNQYLQQLLSTMMYVIESPRCSVKNDCNSQEEMEGYAKNTSRLILRKQCAHAA